MIRRASASLAISVLLAAAMGCSSGEASTGRADSASAAAMVVDSIFPVEEALRRFRVDVPAVDSLTGGAPSREALVRGFFTALERRDTSALRSMVMSRAEFAWLYYPTSVFAREPFYQMPQVTWFLNVAASEKGITRALERYGGDGPQVVGYECSPNTRHDGGLTFTDGCVVDLVADGTTRRMQLFGSIIEHRGSYKFYSYANDL